MPIDITQILRDGLALHQRGKLPEAIKCYHAILAVDSNHFDALHLSGIAATQTGQFEPAITLLSKAISLNPSFAAVHSSLGNALHAAGRLDEAITAFDQATALQPDYFEAHYNRGNTLNALKRHEAALASYNNALSLRPDHAESLSNRGVALNDLKRHAEAVASYDQAISLKPDYAEAHSNRGVALDDLKRHDEAVASFDRAIALQPDYAEAYSNRGNALNELQCYLEALASYDKAIALKPDYVEAHSNRGTTLADLKRYEEALAGYGKAIDLNPDYADAHWNQGLLLLLLGRFEQGWGKYEWRKKLAQPVGARSFPQPLWLGNENLAGKTLLIHHEQGLGDSIQFCRYAVLASELGATILFQTPRTLIAAMRGLAGVDRLIADDDPVPEFDLHCPLMSLPFALKTTLSTIPCQIPYLYADAEKVSAWNAKLGPKIRPRIGLVWSGGFRPDQPELWPLNARRNIPFQKMARLNRPDFDFYSLQKGEPAESEVLNLQESVWHGDNFHNFADALKDLSDTAALIQNLDLIVSVDTATAHLAGALGKPVWILNRFDSCWRWLLDRSHSPWYPTARLYRQERPGDWDSVLERVRIDLENHDLPRGN